MLPYFFLLFISAIFPLVVYRPAFFSTESGYNEFLQKRNKTTFIFFFFYLFLLLAVRDITVGNDLLEYKMIFNRSIVSSFEDLSSMEWELGYLIYNKLIALIFTDYRVLLIVTAIVTLLPIYKLYSREERYGFLAIVLFINMPCFLILFSGLRQAISISIGILVYMALEKKKYIASLLLMILAIYFHVSAFVLVLIYPAFFLKIKAKHLFYIILLMITIYLFRIPILQFVLGLLPGRYLEFYGEVEQTGAFGMMILFLMFFVFSFVVLDETAMSKRDYFMRNVLLIATVFQLFVPIHGLIQRASYYFLIFVPISVISVVQAPKKYLKTISDFATGVMTCFFTIYFFLNSSFSTDNLLGVFPYKFFWSGEGW